MRASSNSCSILILLCLISASIAQETVNPGIKFTVSSNVLTTVTSNLVPKLENYINSVSIPGNSGSVGIPVVGTFSWDYGSITLSDFDFSDTTISSVPGVGLLLSISDASGTIALGYNWKFRSILFGDSKGDGTATVDDSGASINVEIAFGESNNRATATLTENSIDLNHFNIVITTKNLPDWIINIIEDIFNSDIKSKIEDAVSSAITTEIASLNAILQSEPIAIPLGNSGLGINIGLPVAPTFTSTYMSIGLNGGFYQVNNPYDVSPYTASALPDQVDASSTLNVILDQYVFDTAGFAMWQDGLLNFILPSNTSEWKAVIPNLYQDYPNDPMNLVVNCTSAPNVNFTSSGIQFTSYFSLIYDIVNSNGTETPVLTLGLQANSNLDIYLNYTSTGSLALYGTMSKLSLQTSVISSSIGHVDIAIINTALLTLADAIIIPEFNKVFEAGIPLPVSGSGTISDEQVLYGTSYVAVVANF